MTFRDRVESLVNSCSYKTGWTCLVEESKTGALYLQFEVWRPDVHTNEWGFGRGGKAYLNPEMSDGDIVRKVFQLAMAFEEHEAREFFKYNGVSVFGPHIQLSALVEAAGHTDQ